MNIKKIDQKVLDITIIILTLCVLVTTIWIIVIFEKDSFDCLANPVNYYEQLKNKSCYCINRQPYMIDNFNLSIPK